MAQKLYVLIFLLILAGALWIRQHLCSPASSQGCVRSPLLFILYNNDCRSQYKDRNVLKFTDDTVVVSQLHGNESSRGPVVTELLQRLHVSKTQRWKKY